MESDKEGSTVGLMDGVDTEGFPEQALKQG